MVCAGRENEGFFWQPKEKNVYGPILKVGG